MCISQFDSQSEIDRCFSLAWILDDGSRQILCYGFWKASLVAPRSHQALTLQDLLKIAPDELLSIEIERGAHPSQFHPTLSPCQIQGLGIRLPPSLRMPLAVQSIIGHKFWVGISKMVGSFLAG